MMDCRKPSAGFIDNMHTELLADGMKELNKVLRELDGKQIKIEKKRKWFG